MKNYTKKYSKLINRLTVENDGNISIVDVFQDIIMNKLEDGKEYPLQIFYKLSANGMFLNRYPNNQDVLINPVNNKTYTIIS